MGIFGKKKKEVVQEEVRPTPEEASISDTQAVLSDARVTLDELIRALNDLNDRSVQNAMQKKALENDAKMKEKQEAEAAAMISEGGEGSTRNLLELEKDLYIMPEDLQVYVNGVNTISRLFASKSSAESVDTGADEVNKYMKQYILSLKAALEAGQKLKANACIDALSYALLVAYKKEDTDDPQELAKRQADKVEFVSETCKDLLGTIDSYYGNMANLEIYEHSYYKNYVKYMELYDQMNRTIPPEAREKLETLKFKRAMETLPPGDPMREFFPLILEVRSRATQVMFESLKVESVINSLTSLQTDISELLTECQRVKNLQGANFNYVEHQKVINKMRQKGINRIKKMQEQVTTAEKMDTELMALVDEAAANAELGKSVANSMAIIRRMEKNENRNQELRKQIEEMTPPPMPLDNEMPPEENEQGPILASM